MIAPQEKKGRKKSIWNFGEKGRKKLIWNFHVATKEFGINLTFSDGRTLMDNATLKSNLLNSHVVILLDN